MWFSSRPVFFWPWFVLRHRVVFGHIRTGWRIGGMNETTVTANCLKKQWLKKIPKTQSTERRILILDARHSVGSRKCEVRIRLKYSRFDIITTVTTVAFQIAREEFTARMMLMLMYLIPPRVSSFTVAPRNECGTAGLPALTSRWNLTTSASDLVTPSCFWKS
jgi:hypothetical protein